MRCPIEGPGSAETMLAYCARKLPPEQASEWERHLEVCPDCRKLADDQAAVWSALEEWEAMEVSADFDRRLYARIAQEVSWWERLVRPFRPMLVRQGLPIAAAACLAVMAGILVDRPDHVPVTPPAETVQADQVENQLEDMELLRDFSHTVRTDAAKSNL
jgi:anti-sigma factor RsiW